MTAPKPPTALELREEFALEWRHFGTEPEDDAIAAKFDAGLSSLLAAARAEAVAPLEARVAELTAALRALVETLPTCGEWKCVAPATCSDHGGAKRWCDAHAVHRVHEYPRAATIAAALALLAKEPTP